MSPVLAFRGFMDFRLQFLKYEYALISTLGPKVLHTLSFNLNNKCKREE